LHSLGKSGVAENEQCCAIPGTSSFAHLEENMAAAKLQLSADEWKKIEDLVRGS
jgi:aryl-alcohol dehydrogenase-like predicted oxidoreductase